jgi:hypothetical protein
VSGRAAYTHTVAQNTVSPTNRLTRQQRATQRNHAGLTRRGSTMHHNRTDQTQMCITDGFSLWYNTMLGGHQNQNPSPPYTKRDERGVPPRETRYLRMVRVAVAGEQNAAGHWCAPETWFRQRASCV